MLQLSKLTESTPLTEAWLVLAKGCEDLKTWTAALRPNALLSLSNDLMTESLERVTSWQPPASTSKEESQLVRRFLEATAAVWSGDTMFVQQLRRFKSLLASEALEDNLANLRKALQQLSGNLIEEELRAVEVSLHACSGLFLAEQDKEGHDAFLKAADSLCIWDGFPGCVEKVRRGSDLAVMLLEMVPRTSDYMAMILQKLTCIQEALTLPQLLLDMRECGPTFAEHMQKDPQYEKVKKVMVKAAQVREAFDMIPSGEDWSANPRVVQFQNWRKAVCKKVEHFVGSGSTYFQELVKTQCSALASWAGGAPEGGSWLEHMPSGDDEWAIMVRHAEKVLFKQDAKEFEKLIGNAGEALIYDV